jgi:uncharacterized protein YodC (DUF2158 family)
MANAFKKGDVVILKSGGPPMTVDKVPGDHLNDFSESVADDYHVAWFKGATASHGRYPEHVLEKYTPPVKR